MFVVWILLEFLAGRVAGPVVKDSGYERRRASGIAPMLSIRPYAVRKSSMRYIMTTALGALLVAGLSLSPARSQAPSPPNIGQAPARAPEDHIRELRGTVQAVDRETKVLRVTHDAGSAPDTTLLMSDDTEVQVQGRPGSLADIQQGTRIRASYQPRYGLNLARSIEITG